ncbi:amylo-alpha-1,6-glucosidase [Pseudolysinimonas yzui]|nr:glycogen debranching N-terminal domain-containing protein [Pseudolysinimonas yzui]
MRSQVLATRPLQPFLHDAVVVLRAPAQAWSRPDGSMGNAPIDGIAVSDVRVVSGFRLTVAGLPGEHVGTLTDSASRVRFRSAHRSLDAKGADPDVRGTLTRVARADGVRHEFELSTRLTHAVEVDIVIKLDTDLTELQRIKHGIGEPASPVVELDEESARWGDGVTRVTLDAPGAIMTRTATGIQMLWRLAVPARGGARLALDLRVVDRAAVVGPAGADIPWHPPKLDTRDSRLRRWVDRSLDDLDALRLTAGGPEEFLAAGGPWYLTLFGRDAIWAARFLLPLGSRLPIDTLRVLARRQGTEHDISRAEQPGKILHELRRGQVVIPEEGVALPPTYYGTVDATPLWILLLVEVRASGVDLVQLREFRPALEAALAWMRDFGDRDGDGLLEYFDPTGHGLSNQGWKDSADAVQWRDGRLAQGPLALCEVQGYAYAAAMGGADLLDEFGGDGTPWREWAAALATAFRAGFWVDDPDGAFPAVALDTDKRAVDSLTSNIGHLLGTGILSTDEAALVRDRLRSPELSSGFGLRTLATSADGYWPLSYHGGSVWTHDTAIAIVGLAAEGFTEDARELARGLLRAAETFEFRIPELYSGDGLPDAPTPLPYPAACRPQAWSAAASIAVLRVFDGVSTSAR